MDERGPAVREDGGAPENNKSAKKGLSKRGKTAIIVAAVVVALLMGSYLGLCAYASGDRVIPGTTMGGVDLSGLTVEEAAQKVEAASRSAYDTLEIPIQVGDKTVTFSAKEAQVTASGDGEAAVRAGKGSFLAGGWNFLAGALGRETQLNCQVVVGDPDYLNKTLDAVVAAVDQPVEDPHWEVDDQTGAVTLYRGRTGQSVDRDAIYNDLMAALSNQGGTVTGQVFVTAPKAPDFAAMKADIDREPENATLDVATDEIIPHKLGLTLDLAQAEALFDRLAEGESGALSVETQEPEVTTLKLRASLFRDLLGEGTSKISGTAGRVGNVELAAAACNGVVLLPGEQMSYNQTTGQRTTAKGYRKASGYTAKGIEDMVGGGVCQPSSTLYLACLNANLEIVQRSNHRYTVSYMPDGMDATVSWPNLDYVFANNTPYPIKVVTDTSNRVLTVRIYGTKTDDTYVKMESVRLSTTPAGVKYEPDETVPLGTTKVIQGAHTGKKVQVYKNIYKGDGTLLSRELISTDTYRPGDKIVAYNPADGAPDGSVAPTVAIDPVTGWPLDPVTGLPVDPATLPVDPATGQPILPSAQPTDPGTGLPVDPGSGLPVDPTTGAPVDPTTGLPMDPEVIDPSAGITQPADPATQQPTDPAVPSTDPAASAQPAPVVTTPAPTTQPAPSTEPVPVQPEGIPAA